MRKAYLALFFFGLLAYINAIRHPFVHDDVVFILQNPHIADLGSWLNAFKVYAATNGINTYYRPVLEIIYRLEYHFFGLNPFGFHLFNILVHIINGLLLFRVLLKVGLRQAVAWVVALLFLIHPLQTEAVSCISGISNLWMAFGILLALNAYFNKWHIVSVMCFVMAFLSKEQAVLFVPLVIVLDYSRGTKNFRSWIIFGITAGILLWLRQHVTGVSILKDVMLAPGELYLRLAAIPRVIGMDLRLMLCPYDLHYYRSTDILQSNSVSWILALISFLLIFYIFKRWPQTRLALILGLGWFLAALLPVLNIAPLINEYSFILTAEHFLYLPIIGVLIIAALGVDYFVKHFRKLILGVIISSCLLLSWYQNTFWRSEIALFERMLRFEPDFGRGHLLLAKAYYFNGRPGQADGHFRKAFTIMSSYVHKATNMTAKRYYLGFVKEILFDWAQNDCTLGRWGMALVKYKRAIMVDDKDATLYNNMALAYLHLGDKKNAYLSLQQAVQLDPSYDLAHKNLEQLGKSP